MQIIEGLYFRFYWLSSFPKVWEFHSKAKNSATAFLTSLSLVHRNSISIAATLFNSPAGAPRTLTLYSLTHNNNSNSDSATLLTIPPVSLLLLLIEGKIPLLLLLIAIHHFLLVHWLGNPIPREGSPKAQTPKLRLILNSHSNCSFCGFSFLFYSGFIAYQG